MKHSPAIGLIPVPQRTPGASPELRIAIADALITDPGAPYAAKAEEAAWAIADALERGTLVSRASVERLLRSHGFLRLSRTDDVIAQIQKHS